MATRMQQRRGTASQWTTANPILATGEIGFETDTNQFKIGDGTNNWGNLSYFKNLEDLGGSLDDYLLIENVGQAGFAASLDVNGYIPINQLGNIIGDAPEILDTIDELAAAVDGVDGIVGTKITEAVDAALAQVDYNMDAERVVREAAEQNLESSISTSISNANEAMTEYVDSEISSSIAAEVLARDAAIVQAINNEVTARDAAITQSASSLTGNLESFATDAAGDAQSAAQTAAQGYVSDHNADTTNVHGITDTANLVYTSDLTSGLSGKQDVVSGVSSTEIGYLDGVTSAIQTQIDGKSASGHGHAVSDVTGLQVTLDEKADLAGASFTGDVEVDGNLVVEGDLTVNGTNFAASATSITIEDNLVQLAHSNSANTVDLGIVVGYNDGAAKHSGVVRDVSADAWKIFKGVTTEPTTTVAFGEGSLDNLHVNNLTAAGIIFTDGTQTKQGVPSITDVVGVTTNNGAFDTAPLERDMLIQYTESFAGELTILPDSLKNFPVGSSFDVLQVGTGQLTIVAGNGVTVNATPGLKLRTQWSSATIFKRAENTWVVFGDLSA